MEVLTQSDTSASFDGLAERIFPVISWGAAGTGWLAKTPNSHPDVFCAHGANDS